jgi:hypothetical protein
MLHTEKKTKLYQSISYKNKHKQRPAVNMLKNISNKCRKSFDIRAESVVSYKFLVLADYALLKLKYEVFIY